jgi:hypothetical protein
MKNRLIQFLNTERRGFAILAVSIAIAVLGGMFLCNFLLGKMLRDNAQNTSSAWVSMLVARNPDILKFFSDGTSSKQTRHMLDEVSQVGDIYRFRIWDRTGRLT